MAPSLTNLSEINPDQVAAEQEILAQYLSERFPQYDFKRGPAHDLILHLFAVLLAAARGGLDLALARQSLQAMIDDPGIATPEAVNSVLDNFRVTRRPAGYASGPVTFILDKSVPVVIPAGASLSTGTRSFGFANAISVRTNQASVTGASDLVLRPLGDGRYAFTAIATATEPGIAGRIIKGTPLTLSPPLAHLLEVYAEADFLGGNDAETDAMVLERMRVGIAARAWSNRTTIEAMIRSDGPVPLEQLSIIGAGDPEMLRDKHGLLPLSGFGRCDLYARTYPLPALSILFLTASYLETTDAGMVWQVQLDVDTAPGRYEVTSIQNEEGTVSYELTETISGYALPLTGFAPDIVTATEAAFTAFSTLTVRFVDPDVTRSTTDRSVRVEVRALDGIANLQTFIQSRSVRGPGNDVLVRAPIPIFVSVAIEVAITSGSGPNPDDVASKIASSINALRFPGHLYTSQIAAWAQAVIPGGCRIRAVDLLGRLLAPDGSVMHIFGRDAIHVPDDPVRMISPRTVAFYCDPDSVSVTSFMEVIEL